MMQMKSRCARNATRTVFLDSVCAGGKQGAKKNHQGHTHADDGEERRFRGEGGEDAGDCHATQQTEDAHSQQERKVVFTLTRSHAVA